MPNRRCDSEHQTEKWTTTLNAKREIEWWLWTPKWNYGSKRQSKLDNYERQAENDDFERRNREDMVALNARLEMDDSERRNWEWNVALKTKLQGNDERGNMP